MDMASFQAAYTGLTTAGKIAKGLIDLHTLAEVQAKAIELNDKIIESQGHVFTAQATQATLISRVSELEKEIADMKAWEETKQRYRLTNAADGSFAYALKKESAGAEPAHWICANCYEDGIPSILQATGRLDMGKRVHECHRCGANIRGGRAEYAE